jgi:hypothetical protein
MNWEKTLERLKKLERKKLKSISGKADINLGTVSEDSVTILGRDKSGKKKESRRSIEKLREYAAKMDLDTPVHADVAVVGGGSSRSYPETILANMPDVEWTRINKRKHIVWVGKDTHPLGTLRERKMPEKELKGK